MEQVVQLLDVTCALLVGGSVRCWGTSTHGALGLGSAYESAVGDDEPVDAAPVVDLGEKAIYLAAGDSQTCAILESGAVRCWGPCLAPVEWAYSSTTCLGLPLDGAELVGDDEAPSAFPPLQLAGPAVHVDIGTNGGCAVLQDGRVHCWGRKWMVGHPVDGEIYDGVLRPDETEPISFAAPAIKVDVGSPCAFLADGSVVCWGLGGAWTGAGSTEDIYDAALAAPVAVGGSVYDIAGGLEHVCVLREDDAVLCWGRSGSPYWPGRLGYGSLDDIGDDETPLVAGPVPVE